MNNNPASGRPGNRGPRVPRSQGNPASIVSPGMSGNVRGTGYPLRFVEFLRLCIVCYKYSDCLFFLLQIFLIIMEVEDMEKNSQNLKLGHVFECCLSLS